MKRAALLVLLILAGCMPNTITPLPPAPRPPTPPVVVPVTGLPTWATATRVIQRIVAEEALTPDQVKTELGKPFDEYDPPSGGHVAGYRVQDAAGTGTRHVWVTYIGGVSKKVRDE